jgi:molecular chaperone GrpE
MSEEKSPDHLETGGGNGVTDSVTPDAPDGDTGSPEAAAPVDPLEAAQADAARLKDQLLRVAADFDNFKKRSRREVADASKYAKEDVLRDLLPVFDNLERAAAHAGSATDVKALADGIGMVMRQFLDTLGKIGVERVNATGQPFDPAVHEAVQHLETTEHPPGTVAMELQAGYRTPDRVLRPAMVVVAKAPSS